VRRALALLALAIPCAAFGQDGGSQDDPGNDLAWHNNQQVALAELKAEDGWQVLPGNLKYRRISGDGSGARPTVADTVTVHYAGRLIDGTEFDSSYARGEPATFPLGRLVKAWQLAIPEMGIGDTIELYAPADLAYGPVGKGPIPGNATLIFKVELIDIE
tara:strand:+ start:77 stop:556 length:480 start_codon:yes stop_codon:yes gene_type:complete